MGIEEIFKGKSSCKIINYLHYKKFVFQKKVLDRKNQIWKIICANFLQKYISKHSTVVAVLAVASFGFLLM